jgi:hypothetical protein
LNNIGVIKVGGRNKDIIYKITESGCHEVISHTERGGGYHSIKINGVVHYIHRWYYIKMHPEIDMTDLDVRHKCDNRHCINIDHLEHGTRQENINDIYIRDRHRFELTNDEILDIAFNKTLSNKEMAKKYNIKDVKIVNKIRNGKTWSNITGIKYIKGKTNKKESPLKFIIKIREDRWRVLVKIQNKNRHVGYFKKMEDSIQARDEYLNSIK